MLLRFGLGLNNVIAVKFIVSRYTLHVQMTLVRRRYRLTQKQKQFWEAVAAIL